MLAREDAGAGNLYGYECLFRFFAYGLERRFRADLYDDFEVEVLSACSGPGRAYALEKFWSFHHYLPKGASQIPMRPALAALLNERYPPSAPASASASPTGAPAGASAAAP